MRPRPVWVLVGIVAAAVITVLFAGPGDPYPMPAGHGARQSSPIAVGTTVRAVIVDLQVRPGDRVELLGAEPVGLIAGARSALYLSRAVIGADGSRTMRIDEGLEPIAGAVIEVAPGDTGGPDSWVGIIGELTPDQPGTFELTAVRLRFRINGGGEQVREGISTLWTVCADDPAPTDCERVTPSPETAPSAGR